MSMNNYAPFTTAPIPDTGMGPMSGVRRADADMMLRQAQNRGLQSMDLGNQYQGLINDRYGQSTPHEVEKLAYEAALAKAQRTTPGFIPSVMSGAMGQHQQQAAEGKVAQGTADSRIGTANAAADLSAHTARLMQVRSILSMNPAAGQAAYQQWLMGVKDPNLKRMMPGFATPETIDQTLDALSQTPGQRGQERMKRMELSTSETNNERTNRTAIDVANINAARAMAVAQARLSQFMANNKQSFQQFLTQYAQKRATGKNTPQDDMMAQMIEQMMYQMRAAPAGAIDSQAVEQQIFPSIAPRPTPPSVIPPRPAPAAPGVAAPNNADPLGLFK